MAHSSDLGPVKMKYSYFMHCSFSADADADVTLVCEVLLAPTIRGFSLSLEEQNSDRFEEQQSGSKSIA